MAASPPILTTTFMIYELIGVPLLPLVTKEVWTYIIKVVVRIGGEVPRPLPFNVFHHSYSHGYVNDDHLLGHVQANGKVYVEGEWAGKRPPLCRLSVGACFHVTLP